jgi:hypothetical protein
VAKTPGAMECFVCGQGPIEIKQTSFGLPEIVFCEGCGEYSISREAIEDLKLPLRQPKQRALASHVVRRMQGSGARPSLDTQFFASLNSRSLPTPMEAADNLLLWFAEKADGKPSAVVHFSRSSRPLIATVGAIDDSDVRWLRNVTEILCSLAAMSSADCDESIPREDWQTRNAPQQENRPTALPELPEIIRSWRLAPQRSR